MESLAMANKREEWEQDIIARQRNTVFPDTVKNEGRFWRNLASGKQKLTVVQGIGIALMFVALGTVLWGNAALKFRFASSGSVLERLVPVFADWAIVLVVFVVVFVLFRWRVRRALLSGKRPNRIRD
jgi:hypothetical protein